jgi:predicted dehydrogenase
MRPFRWLAFAPESRFYAKSLYRNPHRNVIGGEIAAGHRFIQLGFTRRFDQSYVKMKVALDQGRLGQALVMHNFHRNLETPTADFTGAMAITNSAPHEFDVARFVFSVEFAGISAFQPRRAAIVAEAGVRALMEKRKVPVQMTSRPAFYPGPGA